LQYISAFCRDRGLDVWRKMVIRLTENPQRKDLNPYDEARGYFDLYKLLSKKDNIDVDRMIRDITKVEMKPETAENLTVVNLTNIRILSGKSMSYVKRMVSILKLPPEAIEALKNKKINNVQITLSPERSSMLNPVASFNYSCVLPATVELSA